MYATSTSRPPGSLRPGEDEVEELAAVIGKPQVPTGLQQQQQLNLKHGIFTTTAPRFNNKTLNSKKSKWPISQEVLRQSTGQKLLQSAAVNVPPPVPVKAPTQLAVNETISSTEKPPQAIPLPQDFENNSIDIDAQQQQQKQSQLSALKLDEHIVVVGTIASPVSDASDSNPPVVHSGAHPIRKYNTGNVYAVYKTVSPPTANLALTTNKVSTGPAQSALSQALDVPPAAAAPVRNNSDNPDALDLQNLSNTNESVDNPITGVYGFEYQAAGLRESNLERRSANQRSLEFGKQQTIRTSVFGQPAECNGDESVSDNCQVRKLDTPRHMKLPLSFHSI